MTRDRFEKEREEFIEASSREHFPYAGAEIDGHPAMQRTPVRRVRHSFKTDGADWIKAAVFLGVVMGAFFVILLIAGGLDG